MRSRRRERNVDSNKSLCMQNHDNNADKAENCVLKSRAGNISHKFSLKNHKISNPCACTRHHKNNEKICLNFQLTWLLCFRLY